MKHSVLSVLLAFRSGWKLTPRATRHQAPGLRQHSGVTDPQQQLQLSWVLLQTHLRKRLQASPPTDRREVRSCMGSPIGGTPPRPFTSISGINSRYRHSTACEANMRCKFLQVIICIALLWWHRVKLQTGRMLDRAGATLDNVQTLLQQGCGVVNLLCPASFLSATSFSASIRLFMFTPTCSNNCMTQLQNTLHKLDWASQGAAAAE